MNTLKKIGDFLGKITGTVNFLTYIGLAVMILVTVADVLLRYFFNSPLTGAMDISEYALLVAVFASFANGQMMGAHVTVTALLVKFPRRLKFIIYTLMNALGTVVIVATSIAAGQQAQIAVRRGYISSILKFKTGPFLWAECILVAFFAFVVLFDTVRSFVAIFNDELAQDMSKDWL